MIDHEALRRLESQIPDGDWPPGKTHFVGDDCPGGHKGPLTPVTQAEASKAMVLSNHSLPDPVTVDDSAVAHDPETHELVDHQAHTPDPIDGEVDRPHHPEPDPIEEQGGDHERNGLVWLAGLLGAALALRPRLPGWIIPALWLAGAALVLASCAAPTAPRATELTHPAEVDMQAAIDCAARALGTRALALTFWEDREWLTLADGRLGFVACRAGVGSKVVKCDRRWVHESDHGDHVYTAAHEVSHVAGDYAEPPLGTMVKVLEVCE